MNIVTLDFETFFDDEYSLKKMTTEAYVRDPRFEVLGCAVKLGDRSTIWVEGNNLRHPDGGIFDQIDWSNTACLCHHAHFDGLILSHHYGVKPYAWLDTLSMARLVLGNHLSVALGSLADHYGLSAKSVPYDLFKGKHWAELTPTVRDELGRGAVHDVELTWPIFEKLAAGFPQEEYRVIDTTIRMFTEPTLVGDTELLGKVWRDENTKKQLLLQQLGVTEEDLQSSERFAALLRSQGVEPETKISPGGNKIYAFAKRDDFLKDLCDHDNATVATLAEARLSVKSTGAQTRAERLGWMSTRGPMPVYLNYCGAHTTRWSGGDKVNWQNFKRGGEIRKAIKAPPGHKLAIVDMSQIECRMLNMLAGQQDVIENFRQGKDPYIGIASEAYGFEVTKAHVKERGTGKQLELSCGFMAGAQTIVDTAKLGIYGPPVIIDLATGLRWRDLYRDTHPRVVAYWKEADMVLKRMGSLLSFDWGPLQVRCTVEGQRRIVLPNGCGLIYDSLEWHSDTETGEAGWRIKNRHGWTRMYSGKLVENVVQALARVVLSQAMNRITAAGIKVVLLAHDELVACLPDDNDICDRFEFIKREMKLAPGWLPEIPLDVEGVLSERYEK